MFATRNDVRIPGDEGTEFSLVDGLDSEVAPYGRARIGWDLGRHGLQALAAPVRLSAEGRLDRDVRFAGETFAAGTSLDASYQFDTYRLSYRYLLIDERAIGLGLGATALLRVAEIRVEGAGRTGARDDLGFVPLLRVEARWSPLSVLDVWLRADGLAAPQGRAFDVLLAAAFPVTEHVAPYVGYRFIEGGADNDEVYTFSFLHFVALGVRFSIEGRRPDEVEGAY